MATDGSDMKTYAEYSCNLQYSPAHPWHNMATITTTTSCSPELCHVMLVSTHAPAKSNTHAYVCVCHASFSRVYDSGLNVNSDLHLGHPMENPTAVPQATSIRINSKYRRCSASGMGNGVSAHASAHGFRSDSVTRQRV